MLVSMVPDDGTRIVTENVRGFPDFPFPDLRGSITNDPGGFELGRVGKLPFFGSPGFDGGRDLDRSRRMKFQQNIRSSGIDDKRDLKLTARIAGGDGDPAFPKKERLAEGLALDERVWREGNTHAAELEKPFTLAPCVHSSDIEEQIAILFQPDVEPHDPVADGHGTRRVPSGAVPDDIIGIKGPVLRPKGSDDRGTEEAGGDPSKDHALHASALMASSTKADPAVGPAGFRCPGIFLGEHIGPMISLLKIGCQPLAFPVLARTELGRG